jgi:hypothetical protein
VATSRLNVTVAQHPKQGRDDDCLGKDTLFLALIGPVLDFSRSKAGAGLDRLLGCRAAGLLLLFGGGGGGRAAGRAEGGGATSNVMTTSRRQSARSCCCLSYSLLRPATTSDAHPAASACWVSMIA